MQDGAKTPAARRGRLRAGSRGLAAIALVGAGTLGAGALGSALAGSANAATASCSFSDFGNTGWTGLPTVPTGTSYTSGWYTNTPAGTWDMINYNDSATASTDVVTHAVSGLPGTGAQIQFTAQWGQGINGSNTVGQRSVLTVSYAGVVYAKITTPGPNDSPQTAVTAVLNGATITPAASLAEKTPTTFVLSLPDGVPASANLSISMETNTAGGVDPTGRNTGDDWFVSAVGTNAGCDLGSPVADPAVLGGVAALGAVGAVAIRRNRKTVAVKRQNEIA